MLGIRQPGGIAVAAIFHAQFFGVLVHQVGEGRLAACHVLGQRDACVVAGLDDHPLQQHRNRHLAAQVDEGPRAAGPPCGFADGHRIFKPDALVLDVAEYRIGSHQLGDAGRIQSLVLLQSSELLPGGVIHQHVGFGTEGRWRGDLQAVCALRQGGGQSGQSGQPEQAGQYAAQRTLRHSGWAPEITAGVVVGQPPGDSVTRLGLPECNGAMRVASASYSSDPDSGPMRTRYRVLPADAS